MTNNEIGWVEKLTEDELFDLINPLTEIDILESDDPNLFDLWEELGIEQQIFNNELKKRIETEHSIDIIGKRMLPRAIDGYAQYISWPDYWWQFKNEFKLLVCTQDKKYQTLRKKLIKKADKSHTTIVSAIAAVVAANFGVTAGVLIPFVAMCLIAILRMGIEAFCATLDLDIPITLKSTLKK